MRNKRKKIWIDRFQTKLSLCIGLYFAIYQVAVWALIIIERHLSVSLEPILGPPGVGMFAFLTIMIVILGFLFIYDAVKLTHRVVGPLYRFRKTIEAIKAGEEVHLVGLRENDFLQEMKDELNDMIRVLEERGAVTLSHRPVKEHEENLCHALAESPGK